MVKHLQAAPGHMTAAVNHWSNIGQHLDDQCCKWVHLPLITTTIQNMQTTDKDKKKHCW